MDLRAARKPHVSVPSLPAAGTERPPRPARRFPAPERRGPAGNPTSKLPPPAAGTAALTPQGRLPCGSGYSRGGKPRAPPLPPPGPRRPPPALPRRRRPPRVPSPAPGRRPNGRGGAGGRARGALSASPAPTQPSPRVPAAAGLAREGTKRLREAAASAEEEAHGPLSGVTLAPRSRLPRINKIFKMAVREGKRECGGQSGPRARSWRARVGEAGLPGASAGSPGRGAAARGRPGRGRRGGALWGRRGFGAWLVGSLLRKRAGRVQGGWPA